MEKALVEIVFRCTETTFGSPEPFIENGRIIILVQNGKVTVGKYHAATDSDPSFYFTHPKNEETLKIKALELIKMFKPHSLKNQNATFFTCPTTLEEEAAWD